MYLRAPTGFGVPQKWSLVSPSNGRRYSGALGKPDQLSSSTPYLEGQGDLVSRLIMGITRVTMWVIGVINLLTKSP